MQSIAGLSRLGPSRGPSESLPEAAAVPLCVHCCPSTLVIPISRCSSSRIADSPSGFCRLLPSLFGGTPGGYLGRKLFVYNGLEDECPAKILHLLGLRLKYFF